MANKLQKLSLVPIGWNGLGDAHLYKVLHYGEEICRGTLSECRDAMDREENKETRYE